MRDAGTGAPDITLLSVDDEPALLGLTRRFLERSGDCSVTTARSAPSAIQLLSKQRSDAIVSDYQMPDMDGISFLRHLRENGDTTPFIIFTGRGSPVLKAEYTRRGGITGPSIRLPWLRNNPLQTLTAGGRPHLVRRGQNRVRILSSCITIFLSGQNTGGYYGNHWHE